jgi:hypothetical protein
MPFNGDFYTQDEGTAPSHDFYTQNMKNKGVLPGSWQMRQAYANGSGGTEGSNPNSPSFQTSFSRNVGDRLGGNSSTYNARGVTGTTSVPTSGESYNSQRYGKTGSSEENTINRVFGTFGKAKTKKDKNSKTGGGSSGDQGSDADMAIGSNNTNSQKFGRNASQSGNQSGGANIQAGGDINFGKSVGAGATNTGTGVQQIGGHGSRQTNNQFMFDPNHPAWSGDGGGKPKGGKPKGDKPKGDKPKGDKPKGDKTKGDTDTKWAPEDMGKRDMGLPRKGQPGSNTGGMPSQYEGMGGDYDATGTGSTPPTKPTTGGSLVETAPDQGDNFGGGDPRRVTKTRRKGTPGQAEQPYPKPTKRKVGGQGPSWEQGDEGSLAKKFPDAIEGTSTEGTPTTGLPTTPSGTDIEKFRGGVPAGTGQTPTTGAPPTVENSTGAPKGPGFFGRMWNKAADRVMTAPGGGPMNYGPGAEYTRTPDRGLPAGPQVMGEIGTGAPAPMGEIGPGPRGIGPGSRVMGAIGAGDSPASAPIQQVNPRGTYGHPMNGDFGGRGPARRGPQTTRFGDMGMGVPMQGSVPNGGMPPQYEGMGGDYDATGPQPATSRHPRPGGPRTPYEGPSRHPRPPLPAGSSPYVGPSRHPRPGQAYPSQGVEASRRFGVESDDYGRPQDYNY